MRIRRISSREPNKCPGMDQQKAKTGGGEQEYTQKKQIPVDGRGDGRGRGGGNILNVSFLFRSILILSKCMIHSLGYKPIKRNINSEQ